MVLTTQNRQSRHAERHAQLDLQVNLLAEQKVAKLIALVEELRRDMPSVPDRVDPVAEGMTEPLDPEVVLTVLEDGSRGRGQSSAPSSRERGRCDDSAQPDPSPVRTLLEPGDGGGTGGEGASSRSRRR